MKKSTNNATKTNNVLTIDFDVLAIAIRETVTTGNGTKKSLVKTVNAHNVYTSTTATDTVNYNDLYMQLNVTDKPRFWFKKTGFQFQYDKNAKRDNRTEFYEKLGDDNGFTYCDTPSYGNHNRTSTMIDYKMLPILMKTLFENGIISTL